MDDIDNISKPTNEQSEHTDDMTRGKCGSQRSKGDTIAMTPASEAKVSNVSQNSQEESGIDILITALEIAIQRVKEEDSGKVHPDAGGQLNHPTTKRSVGNTCPSANPDSATEGNISSKILSTGDDMRRFCDEVCKENSRESKSLQVHVKKRNDSNSKAQKLACGFCHAVFADKKYLKKHERRAHMGTPTAFCDQCAAHFVSPSFLRTHKANSHGTSQTNEKDLNSAANTNGTEPDLTCDICQRTCSNPRNLETHKHLLHSGTPIAFCDMCPAHFSSTRSLSLHKTQQHNAALKAIGGVRKRNRSKVHFCTGCNYSSVFRSNVNRHQRGQHGDAPQFPCTYNCGYVSKTTTSRKIHEMHCHKAPKRD